MNRLTLAQVRASNIPKAVGRCATDPTFLDWLNEAQDRLVTAGGDTGWWGGWARMVFNVNRESNPYITTPRDVARLINIDVCKHPVRIQNEFYEFLEAGIGLQAPDCAQNRCAVPQAYDRGTFPTFLDHIPGDVVRVTLTDLLDIGKTVLIQGTDNNDNKIYSEVNGVQVSGVQVVLAAPFTDTDMSFTRITGIQKEITTAPVAFYSADQFAGDQTLILTMEPGETVANYRRYFLNGMPKNCCNPPGDTDTFQVAAMAKLELIPVKVDSDYLLIQSLPALKAECQVVRYSEMDTADSAQLRIFNHKEAIRHLNGQLVHYLGKEQPAINFAPFGTAKLRRQAIGTLT